MKHSLFKFGEITWEITIELIITILFTIGENVWHFFEIFAQIQMPITFNIIAFLAFTILLVIRYFTISKNSNTRSAFDTIFALIAIMAFVIMVFLIFSIMLITSESVKNVGNVNVSDDTYKANFNLTHTRICYAVFSFEVMVLSSIILARDIANQMHQARDLLKQVSEGILGPEYATTATLIPFIMDGSSISTYLIANKSYKSFKWMFPGGHTFPVTASNDDVRAPENLAIYKAKNEAGLDVHVIDLYKSFDINTFQSSRGEPDFRVLNPPHFTYLFELSETVKCYTTKGHRWHYDSVFVGEVYREEPEIPEYRRLKIILPNTQSTLEEITQLVSHAISDYVRTDIEVSQREEYSTVYTYISKMLYEAHTDYIRYIAGSQMHIGEVTK